MSYVNVLIAKPTAVVQKLPCVCVAYRVCLSNTFAIHEQYETLNLQTNFKKFY